MKKTTMYLPDELLAELQLRARQEGRAVAEIVREASAAYLAKGRRTTPPWVGVADGPGDGRSGAALKDDLRAEWGAHLDRRRSRRDADA